MSHKTILPYVGGKQKVVRKLVQFFPDGLTEMGSPFMGGGSVEIHMQAKGVRVYAADLCRELAVFWQMMLSRPVDVAEAFKAEIPIKYPFGEYWERIRNNTDDVEIAVVFYILTRCGFSHIPARTGGSLGKIQKFNRRGWRSQYINLRRFSAPNLSVECLDCFEFLERYPNLFLYCDPPYASGSQDLYGVTEDLHSGFPHERWAEALRGRRFVQSYGDCELIRNLYSGWCDIHELQWFYSSKVTGGNRGSKGHELVIVPK